MIFAHSGATTAKRIDLYSQIHITVLFSDV